LTKGLSNSDARMSMRTVSSFSPPTIREVDLEEWVVAGVNVGFGDDDAVRLRGFVKKRANCQIPQGLQRERQRELVPRGTYQHCLEVATNLRVHLSILGEDPMQFVLEIGLMHRSGRFMVASC